VAFVHVSDKFVLASLFLAFFYHPWQEYYYNVITKRAKWADPPEGRMWERKLALLEQLTPRAVDPTAVTRGLVPGGRPAAPPQWKWRETVRASERAYLMYCTCLIICLFQFFSFFF